jgi:hypothetical protein
MSWFKNPKVTHLLAVLVTAILAALIGIVKGMDPTPTPDDALTAPKTTCDRAQCDLLLSSKFANATRGVCACCAILFGTSCVPSPTPVPPIPVPVVDGGSVVVFPSCPQGFAAPHYSTSQIQKWKATLGPKLQPHPMQLLDEPVKAAPLARSFFRSLLKHSFNQGSLGSCTENAMLGVITCEPFSWTTLTEVDAINGYKWATANDPFPGQYPPTDTGSDGASACKALVHFGWAKSCFPTHYSLAQAETQLQSQGIAWGINWHSDSYQLTGCGELAITGGIDGGHQLALIGLDPVYLPSSSLDLDRSYMWGLNSWGDEWGLCINEHCGYYRVSLRKAQKLINEGAAFDGPNP